MAILNIATRRLAESRRKTPPWIWLVVWALLSSGGQNLTAQTIAKEYQVKAAFLYNFSQFVEWPEADFPDKQSPLVIGVIGDDPFGAYLDEIVRGEKVDDHPLVVQRYQKFEQIQTCHILFVSRSENKKLEAILAGLKGRNILTVGDFEGFALRGGMIRLFTQSNKIRFRVNVEAAKAADLTISSKLLKAAEIVVPGKD